MIDGLPNFYTATHSSGLLPARLERGINRLRLARHGDDRVRPAILISSSPHKAGSASTPWHDVFDIDRGHVRYFGDNKPGPGQMAPHAAEGNAALLEQFALHQSAARAERVLAAPLLLFRRLPYEERIKGQVEFAGVGLVERTELVTQVDAGSGLTFPNYRFDFAVVSLTPEDDTLAWEWIDARRRPGDDPEALLAQAPSSWRRWVDEGPAVLDQVRRRVIGSPIVSPLEQLPAPGSAEKADLDRVYGHYKRASGGPGEHGFEAVAERIARHVLGQSGRYHMGWITRKSGDRGIDFVARLDVGTGFATAKLVVLGQAKCEHPSRPTSALDMARTVARLQRGWLGIYVTTSFFSVPTQVEAAEDSYPLVLVSGRQVAETVRRLAFEEGFADLEAWLTHVDGTYAGRLRARAPGEILGED